MIVTEDAVIRPQPGPQSLFLSTSVDIAIFGGAAGGGKTFGLLLEAARRTYNPQFYSVILRRSFPQVNNPGGLWDESMKLYPYLGAVPKRAKMLWQFPSGSRVEFHHLQHETTVLEWQGSQVPLFCFDELTHFSARQFFYLLSRNRSVCGIRPYIRATCNPDAESWVANFIAWWIDQDTGFAIPERAGVPRWFIRIGDKMEWGDSREELLGRYHTAAGEGLEPKSVTFIPSRIYDNQILMKMDPGYLANLMALPLVDRERLLGGNWKIRPTAGKVFNRAWFKFIEPAAIPHGGQICRFWDLAASVKKLAGDDPDFTASVKMLRLGDMFIILDVTNDRLPPPMVDRMILSMAEQDAAMARERKSSYSVRWEIEPAAAGKRDTYHLVTMLKGYDCGGIKPQGDKVTRAKASAAQAEHGNVYIVKAAWNEEFLSHMHHQPDTAHDDIMDSFSGAFNFLSKPSGVNGIPVAGGSSAAFSYKPR